MKKWKENNTLGSVNLREAEESSNRTYRAPALYKAQLGGILRSIEKALGGKDVNETDRGVLERAYSEISKITNFPRFKVNPKTGYSEKGFFDEGQLPPELCLLYVKGFYSYGEREKYPICEEISNEVAEYMETKIEDLGMEEVLKVTFDVPEYIYANWAFYYQGDLYRFVIPAGDPAKRMIRKLTQDGDYLIEVEDAAINLRKETIFNIGPRIIKVDTSGRDWKLEKLLDYRPESLGRGGFDTSKATQMVASKLIKEFKEDPSRIEDYLA